MMRKISTVLMVVVATATMLSWAEESTVDIDARGGKIVSAPDKVYRITTATGEESGVKFDASESTVTVKGVRQAQNEVEAVLEIGSEQTLAVGTLAVEGANKGMTVGDSLYWGTIVPTNGAEFIELDAGDASSGGLEIKSKMFTGVSYGEAQNKVLKRGEGVAKLTGEYSVVITNVAGKMAFGGAVGEGALFAASSLGRTDDELKLATHEVSDFKETENVFTTTEPTALTGFKVIDGSVAVCRGAVMFDRDVTTDPARYAEVVPECVSVGSNTVGILKLESSSSLAGKVTIGGGETQGARSYGAVYVEDGSVVTNFASTAGECIFSKAGYGHVYIGEGSEMLMAGAWQAGGQFMMTIDGGILSHSDSSWRESGFTIGGSGAVSAIYVANGGVFDASEIVADYGYISELGTQSQFTLEDDGSLILADHGLSIGGTATFNLNVGGTIAAANMQIDENSLLQFDGGTFEATIDGESLIGGMAIAQANGAKIFVPEDMSVDLGSPILMPNGKGVDSIAMPENMAGVKFAGPPVVRISGAKGATAICEYDNETHAVIGIKVTGRGYGASSAISATVEYGTGLDKKQYNITDKDIVTSANVSGGLEKRGLGTLVISATCTYTGETSVVGGTLKLAKINAINSGTSLNLAGGAVLDLANQKSDWLSCSNLRGDGTGKVINGKLTLTGLNADLNSVIAGNYETLNLTNVVFDSKATVKLQNVAATALDRSKTYVLFAFADQVPERMPSIDPDTYAEGLAEGWGIEIENRKAILRYFGGSIFIYY